MVMSQKRDIPPVFLVRGCRMRGYSGRGSTMADVDRWLGEYGSRQENLQYPLVHHLALITCVFGLIGLLWSLPVPEEFRRISPLLNWGTTFLMATVVYYFVIATSLAIGMLPFAVALTMCAWWLDASAHPFDLIAAGALVAGTIGLFWSRHPRGGGTALMTDIQLMMIGPIWLLSRLYRRLGIPF